MTYPTYCPGQLNLSNLYYTVPLHFQIVNEMS